MVLRLCVMMMKAFRSRERLFDDESHFGVEGHREASRLIRDALLPLMPQ